MKLFAVVLVLASLWIGGCGPGSRSKLSNRPDFRQALTQSVVTFDPGKVQDPEAIEMLSNVYEPLVGYDAQNRIEPRLATSWEGSEGGRVWTFHLRPAVKFSNGRLVTAQDFKWSLERNLSKAFGSPVALNYLSGIVGAKDVSDGTTTDLAGVETPDDHTIKITLTEPRAYFLGQITYPCAFVLAKEAAGTTEVLTAPQMVGTGPYEISKILPDQEVDLVANEGYWGGRPIIAKITRPVIKDALTRLNKYKVGDLDYLEVDRASLQGVKDDPKLAPQLVTAPRPTVYYVGLNQKIYKPFQDNRVRRAFAMAIDRHRIADDVLGGMKEAHGLIAPDVPGYTDTYKGLPFDPNGAKKMLSDAGYQSGQGLPTLELSYIVSDQDSGTVAQAIEASLRENANWPVKLRPLEASVFFDERNAGKLPSWYLTWGADYPDPQNFTTFLLRSDSTMNYEGYKNADFDRIGKKADTMLDPARRIQLYEAAQDVLIQDAARVPIYYGEVDYLVNPRVVGLTRNLNGVMPLNKVSLGAPKP